MGERIVRAIERGLLNFEGWMVTLMIWTCRLCGVTTDAVERFREQQKGDVGPASTTHKPRFPPEPRLPSRTAPPPKHDL